MQFLLVPATAKHDFRQWLFHFLAFLQIIRKMEPPAGFIDLVARQLNNNYPGHCILILLSVKTIRTDRTFTNSVVYHLACH